MVGKFVSIQVPASDWAAFGTRIARESEALVRIDTPKKLNRSNVVNSLLKGFLEHKYDIDYGVTNVNKRMKGVVINKGVWKKARKFVIDNEVKGGLSAIVAGLVRAYNNDEVEVVI